MTDLPHLAARVFNTPLLIQRAKLDVILEVMLPRFQGAPLAARGDTPPQPMVPYTVHDGIAVVPIHGTLVQRAHGLDALSGLTSYAALSQSLSLALADEQVRGIVLDVDSHGGEAAGMFDLADSIRSARTHKPIWAVANDAAFSAAYALASAASTLYLTRTAGVGSIGVIALHVDQSQRDAAAGLRYTAITAGAHKADGSPHAPLSPQANAAIQTEVDRLYGLFIDTVAQQRGLSAEAVRGTEAGLYFGEQALAAGLADHVGTVNDAVHALRQHLRPSVSSLPLETSMTTATPDVAPVDLASVRAQARADALAIAELCELAGRPELTATCLTEQLTVGQARQRLVALRASTPEVHSHLSPTPPAENPLIQAVKARIQERG